MREQLRTLLLLRLAKLIHLPDAGAYDEHLLAKLQTFTCYVENRQQLGVEVGAHKSREWYILVRLLNPKGSQHTSRNMLCCTNTLPRLAGGDVFAVQVMAVQIPAGAAQRHPHFLHVAWYNVWIARQLVDVRHHWLE